MESFIELIESYSVEVVFGLCIGLIFLIVLNVVIQIRVSKITEKYNRLVEGVEENSLESILFSHLDEVKEVKNQLANIKEYCDDLDSRLRLSIQKVGIIRYNAFHDMGSDLSFSIALLDDNLNGFVISSIFGRNECNTYAKPIVNGKSHYTLSAEELQAIDKAKQNGVTNNTRVKIS
jgi:hypothetical protein